MIIDMHKAIAHLKEDPKLDKIISSIAMPTLCSSEDVFEDLVSCILDMQIHYRGKAVRYKRLKKSLNGERITNKNLFSISEDGLNRLKISKQKYKALTNLCSYWDAKNLDTINWQNVENTEVRKILCEIGGIGNWTIDMILLYTLQRGDILPVDDFHLKKIMKTIYELDDNKSLKKDMQCVAKSWSPYSSIAVLYLLEFKKNGISRYN